MAAVLFVAAVELGVLALALEGGDAFALGTPGGFGSALLVALVALLVGGGERLPLVAERLPVGPHAAVDNPVAGGVVGVEAFGREAVAALLFVEGGFFI